MSFKKIKPSLYMVRNHKGLLKAVEDFGGALLSDNVHSRHFPGLVFLTKCENAYVTYTNVSFDDLREILRDYD